MFDLDGFKEYNDSFGHQAGDEVLRRLGGHFADAADGHGTPYRLGGDEFCLLVPAGNGAGEATARRAAEALSDSSHDFEIGCSYGTALIPTEAAGPTDALRLSDQRMYANKVARAAAGRHSPDVTL